MVISRRETMKCKLCESEYDVPNAEGVCPVCEGKFSKACQMVHSTIKENGLIG